MLKDPFVILVGVPPIASFKPLVVFKLLNSAIIFSFACFLLSSSDKAGGVIFWNRSGYFVLDISFTFLAVVLAN